MVIAPRYLLDTTVLVDHALGQYGAEELLLRLFGETGDIFTCDAVVAEALTGGTDEERRVIEHLVDALEYVSTSPAAAREAAAFRRDRRRVGRRHLGDAIVAGVAISLGATIVTRNARDFAGLVVPVLSYGTTSA
jgi:predicted nucleic acid-binding protein